VITLLKQKLTRIMVHIDQRFNKLEAKIDQLIQKGLKHEKSKSVYGNDCKEKRRLRLKNQLKLLRCL
jgi:hypothetical protein